MNRPQQPDLQRIQKQRSEITRGQDAQALRDNPLLAEALDAYDTQLLEGFANSPIRDTEGRDRLRLMLEASKAFRKYLQNVIDTGRLQEIQLERERESLLQRAKNQVRRFKR